MNVLVTRRQPGWHRIQETHSGTIGKSCKTHSTDIQRKQKWQIVELEGDENPLSCAPLCLNHAVDAIVTSRGKKIFCEEKLFSFYSQSFLLLAFVWCLVTIICLAELEDVGISEHLRWGTGMSVHAATAGFDCKQRLLHPDSVSGASWRLHSYLGALSGVIGISLKGVLSRELHDFHLCVRCERLPTVDSALMGRLRVDRSVTQSLAIPCILEGIHKPKHQKKNKHPKKKHKTNQTPSHEFHLQEVRRENGET